MEKASKLKIILSLLKKNGLLFIWIVGGLLIIYAKNKEITLSSIVLSVFVPRSAKSSKVKLKSCANVSDFAHFFLALEFLNLIKVSDFLRLLLKKKVSKKNHYF